MHIVLDAVLFPSPFPSLAHVHIDFGVFFDLKSMRKSSSLVTSRAICQVLFRIGCWSQVNIRISLVVLSRCGSFCEIEAVWSDLVKDRTWSSSEPTAGYVIRFRDTASPIN